MVWPRQVSKDCVALIINSLSENPTLLIERNQTAAVGLPVPGFQVAMATGRGQLFAAIRDCLEKTPAQQPMADRGRPPMKGSRAPRKSTPRSTGFQSKYSGTQGSSIPAVRSSKYADRSHPASTQNFMERLPPEILMKILSYLDASSLFCISYVNKLFCQLTNNDEMWHKRYLLEFGRRTIWKPKDCETSEMAQRPSTVEGQDRPAGYWRRLYFRTVVGHDTLKWKEALKAINHYTGLPSQTENVLRSLRVTWELTVTSRLGFENTLVQCQVYFSESSVTVCWRGGHWPLFHQLASLQVHGVRRAPLNCSSQKKPVWRSLIGQFDMETLSKTMKVMGTDVLVKMILLQPGIIIGLWRGQSSIAFVMASFHYHRLVERSVLGSLSCPYSAPSDKMPFDDVDPNYGLHDYTLHINLHNAETEIMSAQFPKLFCKKRSIRNGFICLLVIHKCNLSQHTPLSSTFHLPWKSDALEGTVANCCVMNLTLLDEAKKPFWCVSSPVSMEMARHTSFSYSYDGDLFVILHEDPGGRVKMELIWIEGQSQFIVVNLAVYLTVERVNKHFGRDY